MLPYLYHQQALLHQNAAGAHQRQAPGAGGIIAAPRGMPAPPLPPPGVGGALIDDGQVAVRLALEHVARIQKAEQVGVEQNALLAGAGTGARPPRQQVQGSCAVLPSWQMAHCTTATANTAAAANQAHLATAGSLGGGLPSSSIESSSIPAGGLSASIPGLDLGLVRAAVAPLPTALLTPGTTTTPNLNPNPAPVGTALAAASTLLNLPSTTTAAPPLTTAAATAHPTPSAAMLAAAAAGAGGAPRPSLLLATSSTASCTEKGESDIIIKRTALPTTAAAAAAAAPSGGGGEKKEKKKKSEYDSMWNARFEELLEYRRRHGDCLVPQRHRENPSLGTWVNTQRRHYKMLLQGRPSSITPQRIRALESVGFAWATARGAPPKKSKQKKRIMKEAEHSSPSTLRCYEAPTDDVAGAQPPRQKSG